MHHARLIAMWCNKRCAIPALAPSRLLTGLHNSVQSWQRCRCVSSPGPRNANTGALQEIPFADAIRHFSTDA